MRFLIEEDCNELEQPYVWDVDDNGIKQTVHNWILEAKEDQQEERKR